jgi:hypothetical protein
MTYSEKLKDPRWQRRRLEVLAAANWTCQECQSSDQTLHVHHNFYRSRTEPWEYPDHALRVVCEECHELAEEQRREFKALSETLFDDPEGVSFNVNAVIGFMKALRMFNALGTCPEHTETLAGYAPEYGFARFWEGDQKDLSPQCPDCVVIGDIAESLWKSHAARLSERLDRQKEVTSA